MARSPPEEKRKSKLNSRMLGAMPVRSAPPGPPLVTESGRRLGAAAKDYQASTVFFFQDDGGFFART